MWAAEAIGVGTEQCARSCNRRTRAQSGNAFQFTQGQSKPVNIDEATKKRMRSLPPQTLHDYETLQPKRTAGWTIGSGNCYRNKRD